MFAPLNLGLKYDQIGDRQKERRTKVICEKFQEVTEHLTLSGLELVSVQLRRVLSGNMITINTQKCRYAHYTHITTNLLLWFLLYNTCRMLKKHQHFTKHSQCEMSEDDRIAMISKLMITYGISYEGYHELRQVEKALPPSYKVCMLIPV